MNKGELMQKLFTKEELRNVDASIPMDAEVDDQYYFVMDYNTNTVFGELVDMRERAKEKGVSITD